MIFKNSNVLIDKGLNPVIDKSHRGHHQSAKNASKASEINPISEAFVLFPPPKKKLLFGRLYKNKFTKWL